MMELDYVTIPNRQLTQNFWLYEFLKSDSAAALGLDNTPNADQLANIERLAEKLQSIRSMLSFHYVDEVFIDITSGFRSKAVNKAAGGSETSDHLKGSSADFKCRTKAMDLRELHIARQINHSKMSFDQLIYYPPLLGERLHLGMGDRMRREVMTRSPHRDGYLRGIVG